jgi:DMSO reductase anchor subunit
MHPAFSVIVFTTASGAGYGSLMMLGALAVAGRLAGDDPFRISSLGISLALIVAGLLASTLHLGRPQRAWRAFSQWRSSWLSREAVASLFTFAPAGLFGFALIALPDSNTISAIAGLAMAACALATLVTTGMIYASLKPIAQWHSAYTVPGYILYALASGAILLHAVSRICGNAIPILGWAALVCTAVAWLWKIATWRHNDALGQAVSVNSATGLGDGRVRSIEWPHSEDNYVMKEMGYRIARKHAARLRVFVHTFAFAVPLAMLVTAMVSPPIIAAIAAMVAVISQSAGLLVERWLFFAEAKHSASLYYEA